MSKTSECDDEVLVNWIVFGASDVMPMMFEMVLLLLFEMVLLLLLILVLLPIEMNSFAN